VIGLELLASEEPGLEVLGDTAYRIGDARRRLDSPEGERSLKTRETADRRLPDAVA
jgi:hypothetical protein